MTDWVNGRYLYRYDLITGDYAGRLHLRAPPQWQQGIAVKGDHIYLTADDGDAEDHEVDNLWRLAANVQDTAAYVTHEHAFSEFRRVGEIEGIAFDENAGEMIVLANRGKRIILGMPKGLYPGYDREIHELYVYSIILPRN
jgi:5-oxoprolinase (ATP-hydrolysing) subunit C